VPPIPLPRAGKNKKESKCYTTTPKIWNKALAGIHICFLYFFLVLLCSSALSYGCRGPVAFPSTVPPVAAAASAAGAALLLVAVVVGTATEAAAGAAGATVGTRTMGGKRWAFRCLTPAKYSPRRAFSSSGLRASGCKAKRRLNSSSGAAVLCEGCVGGCQQVCA